MDKLRPIVNIKIIFLATLIYTKTIYLKVFQICGNFPLKKLQSKLAIADTCSPWKDCPLQSVAFYIEDPHFVRKHYKVMFLEKIIRLFL